MKFAMIKDKIPSKQSEGIFFFLINNHSFYYIACVLLI